MKVQIYRHAFIPADNENEDMLQLLKSYDKIYEIDHEIINQPWR